MTKLTEAQMIYLQDVLGLQGVVLPREIPIALDSIVASQTEGAVQTSALTISTSAPVPSSPRAPSSVPNQPRPATKPEFRATGDLAASALVCLLWAPSGEAWPLDGAAGELARKMIQAMKLGDADVFWIEWKTAPTQRAPDEVLELVASAGFRPALGFGLPAVAGVTGAVAALGQWQDWQGVQLMPTHSLPELLKQPGLKKTAWAHLQMVMKVM